MNKKSYRRFLIYQGAIGIVLVLLGLWFPIFIYEKYGFTSQNIYDTQGHVKGQGIYFYYGLGMGGFAVALGICILLVIRHYWKRHSK
ncbi:hypothetical protein GCM10007862_15800 [Dyella lipolytica]|uniref:Uncharacterized protein n=1 Tax=Dyella lipolytica TaxID=1867835 RepID=A0ABW8ITD0_9GAMM|nr:hypothetical protein [Dyella lipolytica]GLQ46529.1 hypothetical protein GCM10007862_15800 [Dyella lipolytica]